MKPEENCQNPKEISCKPLVDYDLSSDSEESCSDSDESDSEASSTSYSSNTSNSYYSDAGSYFSNLAWIGENGL